MNRKNVHICVRCKERNGEDCTKAGKPWRECYLASSCPLGKFPADLPDDDATVAAIKAEVRRGGCCDPPKA